MSLITHNGTFHADDVFSASVLKMIYPNEKIIRTRDEKYFTSSNIVFDVGLKYDGENFFDHHQIGGAGKRIDNYPYASFGLIWKKFGMDICGSEDLVSRVDDNFVKYVDAIDCGYNPNKENLSISISEIIGLFNSNFDENLDIDTQFEKAVELASEILKRKIKKEESIIFSKKIVNDAIEKSTNDIIILDKYCNWQEEVVKTNKLIVVYKEESNDNWRIRMIPKELHSFETRIRIKKEWGGLSEQDLEKLTGIKGITFCHIDGFIAATSTKESAIQLAELVIKESLT